MPYVKSFEHPQALDTWRPAPLTPGLGISFNPFVRAAAAKAAALKAFRTARPTLPPGATLPPPLPYVFPTHQGWAKPRSGSTVLDLTRRTTVSMPRAAVPITILSRRTFPAVMPAAPPPQGLAPEYKPPMMPALPPTTPVATPEPEEGESVPVQKAGFSPIQLAVIAGVALLVLPGLFSAKRKA